MTLIAFDPFSMEYATDPYPLYKVLRDEAPVFHQEAQNFYAISRYDDVVRWQMDMEAFLNLGGPGIEDLGNTGMLIMKNNPEHRIHKSQMIKVFSPKRMNEMEGFIRKLCVDLLEGLAGRDEIDIINEFSVLVPLIVISELIGIPEEFRQTISDAGIASMSRGDIADPEARAAIVAKSDEIYMHLVRDRRANPREDVITQLMTTPLIDDKGDTRYLSDDEMATRFKELALAGHETIAKTIPNGLAALQMWPSERAKLIADRSLLPGAIEELMRYDAPVQYEARVAADDIDIHGVTIPKGARTLMMSGSAQRDERRFENPDVLDVTRKPDVHSLHFGCGAHKCLGLNLARLQIRIAMEELFARFPRFEVFPERGVRAVLTNVRGYATLPARLGPHA